MSEAQPAETTSAALHDRDSEPFWRALASGEFRLQRCSRCGVLRFPPRALCNRCFGFDAEWQVVSGRGRLVSWIRTHQVFLPAFAGRIPYVVVQVALEEQDDVLLIGGWQSDLDPVVGARVEARITTPAVGAARLDWLPAAGPRRR